MKDFIGNRRLPMSKKHYDNKNDLLKKIREVKKTQARADNAVAATWTAFMMIALLTLYEDLGFRDKRLNSFIGGMAKRNEQYDSGELTLTEIKKRLYDKAGIVVEPPAIEQE